MPGDSCFRPGNRKSRFEPGVWFLFFIAFSIPANAAPDPARPSTPFWKVLASESLSLGTPATIGSQSFSIIAQRQLVAIGAENTQLGNFQFCFQDLAPRQLMINNGTNTRLEPLAGDTGFSVPSLVLALKKAGDGFENPGQWREFFDPATYSEPIRQALGRCLTFFALGFWLHLAFWNSLLVKRLLSSGKFFFARPIRSFLGGLLFSGFLFLSLYFLARSIIGLGIIVLMGVPLFLLFTVCLGANAAIVLKRLLTMLERPLLKIICLSIFTPVVFIPLLIPKLGIFIFGFGMMCSLGSLILSEISLQDP